MRGIKIKYAKREGGGGVELLKLCFDKRAKLFILEILLGTFAHFSLSLSVYRDDYLATKFSRLQR